MKKVTVVDVALELAFGLAIGCCGYFLLLSDDRVLNLVMFPLISLGATLGLAQAAVDLARMRGWRYSLVCGSVFGTGVIVGGHASLAGTIFFWAIFSQMA